MDEITIVIRLYIIRQAFQFENLTNATNYLSILSITIYILCVENLSLFFMQLSVICEMVFLFLITASGEKHLSFMEIL